MLIYRYKVTHSNEGHPVNKDKMIARAVKYGANEAEAATLLDILLTNHADDNLVYVLTYHGFATEKQAEAVAREVDAQNVGTILTVEEYWEREYTRQTQKLEPHVYEYKLTNLDQKIAAEEEFFAQQVAEGEDTTRTRMRIAKFKEERRVFVRRRTGIDTPPVVEESEAFTLPENRSIVIQSYNSSTYFRIEFRHLSHPLEVAYWDSEDGTNDIMQGKTGTLEEVIRALAAFALKGQA